MKILGQFNLDFIIAKMDNDGLVYYRPVFENQQRKSTLKYSHIALAHIFSSKRETVPTRITG